MGLAKGIGLFNGLGSVERMIYMFTNLGSVRDRFAERYVPFQWFGVGLVNSIGLFNGLGSA
jgi:hypothetical protein